MTGPSISDSLGQEQRADVMILTVSETVPGTTAAMLADLSERLGQAFAQALVSGIVLVLRGGHSVAPGLSAELGILCRRLEALPKPVVAVLEGSVGGALWALALASHYRFARAGTQIVMPEARLGFLPGGGITQRLPRLVGAAEAIGSILSTRPEPVEELLTRGSVDRICRTDALSEAVAAIEGGLAPRQTRREARGMRDAKIYLAEVQAFQARVSGDPLDVSRAVVKTVEAALLLPFAQGLAFEAVTLEDLAAAPETRAVAHANQVDRVVRERLRGLAATVKGAGGAGVTRLGLWRPGPERAELVVSALTRGLSVVVGDPDREILTALGTRVDALHESMVPQQGTSGAARDTDRARLTLAQAPRDLSGCDLILLAQPDFPRSDRTLPLVALGHDPKDPDPLPALLPAAGPGGHAEISLDLRASPPVAGRVLDLARKLGWRLQVVGPGGFIAHRLRRELRAIPMRLTEMGFGGADITEGMAAAGLGALPVGKRRAPEGAAYEVAHLALAALANEAARILSEGLGLSGAEVDAAALAAGVMPRWMGGPLFQADLRGMILLRADLQRLAGTGQAEVAPLIEQLIRDGRRFYNPE